MPLRLFCDILSDRKATETEVIFIWIRIKDRTAAKKTTGSGSADAGKGKQFNTGSALARDKRVVPLGGGRDTVTVAYPLYTDGETDALPKGDIAVQPGDSIELLCDYYDLDGGYSASYTLGTEFSVPQSGLTLENLMLDADDLSVTWRLTDIYGNHYWTPVTDESGNTL